MLVHIHLIVLSFASLVLSHGTSSLREAEEAADGAGASEDGPGECVLKLTEICYSNSL